MLFYLEVVPGYLRRLTRYLFSRSCFRLTFSHVSPRYRMLAAKESHKITTKTWHIKMEHKKQVTGSSLNGSLSSLFKWVATWPGAKTAAPPPALNGDKQKPWRGPEEEATQITAATIRGFAGATESRGPRLLQTDTSCFFWNCFLGGDDISQIREGGKTSNVSAKFPSLRLLFQL